MPNATITRILAAVSFSTLAACNPPAAPAPLEGAAIGGYFELVDSRGNVTHWEDFRGRYAVFYFGYTYCPDVCPFDLNRLMRGYAIYAEENPELAEQIQPVFVSIDPERDTPAVVGEYVAKFGDNLMGLTGTPEQVSQAARSFAVHYGRVPDEDADPALVENVGYLMFHSNAAYLMGRNGEPIALVPVDQSPEGVAAVLRQWVN